MNNLVNQKREEFNNAVCNGRFILVAGPCSEQLDPVIDHEGQRLAELSDESLLVVHRRPIWKPRSDPASWHGVVETEPREALSRIQRATTEGGIGVAIEPGDLTHQPFVERSSFVWLGARSVGNTILTQMLGANISTPFGVKTSLNGDVKQSTQMIKDIEEARARLTFSSTAAFLIHRSGGVRNPEAWEEQIREDTSQLVKDGFFRSGKHGIMIDVAHGAEQAHDPCKLGRKTIQGQVSAMSHTISMLKDDDPIHNKWKGIMVEASNVVPKQGQETDPNMPLEVLIELVVDLKKVLAERLQKQRRHEQQIARNNASQPAHRNHY